MAGQMNVFKERQTKIDNLIEKVNPYKKLEPLNFDLRAYYKYIEENNISGEDIPQEILDRFII